ncbi:MAG: SDR family NAD(P)-dependent oxidoreductase [Alphaproteobacteria bacterium]
MTEVTTTSDKELLARKLIYAADLLAGRTVVISGAGSGIGRATAFTAARLGAKVILCGRTLAKVEGAAHTLREAGFDAYAYELNIRDYDGVHHFFDTVRQEHGVPDGLINSAGGQFPQDAIDFSKGGWNAVIDTNLNGTFYMMQAAAQMWRDAGRDPRNPASITNIATVIDRGMLGVAHTCAARAGVIYFSKTVAVEWAPLGIRVNCLAPGSLMTEGMAVYDDEVRASFAMSNPQKRFGNATDIADAAVYMASDAACFITGETLTIDGGMKLWGELWTNGKPDYFKGT